MGTRIVKLTGIAEWAKVFEQNRDLTGWKPTLQAEGSYEKYNGACTIDMILDEDNIANLQAARSSKTPKLDPEGRGMRVKFDRKFDTGYDWSSGAPVVKKADGSAWDFETDGIIGNGSTVETTVADGCIYENSQTISSTYTMTTNKNGISAGPITVSGTVTIPSGRTWVVL